ncbi:MAG: ABC transporter permease [Pyrinomonadaceae bacterium]|nr:ABC transporter permease [Pyrinomonadaceae bacterium]
MAEVEEYVGAESVATTDEREVPAGGGSRGGEDRARHTFHPLIELTLIRLREFLREKEAVFWVFVFPVLLALALGVAFRNTAPEKIRVAVESTTNSPVAEQIVRALSVSGEIEASVLEPAEAARRLGGGSVSLVVRTRSAMPATENSIADASSASLAPANQARVFAPEVEYRYDATRPESRIARLAVDDALQRAQGRAEVARTRDERVTEPGGRYIDFLIPGLIGLNLMGSGMWGLGFNIVTARGRKLLKRFAATPMRRSHYLLSFMMSRLVFLALEVVAVLGFAWLVFGVAVRGSLISVAVIVLLGALTFSGIGLLVAARPTTIEGVSGLMNFVMLPMWMLSGTFFSSARFPEFAQPFIKALPLTAINDSLRAVINEGAPLASNWAALAVLLAWCVVSFVIALRIFRWQ